jgi:rhodanese-related sulfurtransferase
MSNPISREEVEAIVQGRTHVRIFEILPREYFERGHLPGAENLPLAGLDHAVRALVPNLDQPIVTYCSGPTCQNSHIAGRRLVELGYRNVRVFTGGKAAWRDAGLALETGTPAEAAPTRVAV